MLEEFILDQLEKLNIRRDELAGKLHSLMQEEQDDNDTISALLEQEDVGLELFSPRSSETTTKQQITAVKNHIEELQLEQAEVRSQLEQIEANDNKYQNMLLEARNRSEIITPDTEDNDNANECLTADQDNQITLKLVNDEKIVQLQAERLDELENILKKVDNCYDLSHRDRIKCKNELKNLRYYLKALISKSQMDVSRETL